MQYFWLTLRTEETLWFKAEIDRNAYGGQVDSFESALDCGFPGIFIRAPRFGEVPMMSCARYQGKWSACSEEIDWLSPSTPN
ncbi:MAG: hypothetical protein Ct9H90mP16_09720 [Candidatus Poseidoniales archaeon]|nr:MAG: hypothetical protein Ct9H90mP16_09720 [Candidatus Poseidoniales archaeon]